MSIKTRDREQRTQSIRAQKSIKICFKALIQKLKIKMKVDKIHENQISTSKFERKKYDFLRELEKL